VLSLGLKAHEDALKHLPWPAQSPGLNVIKSLLSVLESSIRSRFPPPSSLKQLEEVHEEWYSSPLETTQNIHDSIPRGCYRHWWPNCVLIKKCVSFTTVSIILIIPCIFLYSTFVLINLTTYSLTSKVLLYSIPVCGFCCVYPFSVTEKKK